MARLSFPLFAILPLVPVILSAQAPSILEEWGAAASPQFTLYSKTAGGAARSNASQGLAGDGKALELKVGALSPAGVGVGPTAETVRRLSHGTYSARIKTVDCAAQPDAGVVTGLFTYFNDGTDADQDGLADNSEIDFEWLCAEPNVIYLTLWTDYRDADAKHERVIRVVDLATGKIHYSKYLQAFGGGGTVLAGKENQPEAIAPMPGYNSSQAYHTYGFTWSATAVEWWLLHPVTGEKISLWNYQGPKARIPVQAAHFMLNAWHSKDWYPESRPTAV